MSFAVDLVVASKLVSLLIFVPIYLGALAYALYPRHRERFSAYAAIPLLDDGDQPR